VHGLDIDFVSLIVLPLAISFAAVALRRIRPLTYWLVAAVVVLGLTVVLWMAARDSGSDSVSVAAAEFV
jgi:hypothetical protein